MRQEFQIYSVNLMQCVFDRFNELYYDYVPEEQLTFVVFETHKPYPNK